VCGGWRSGRAGRRIDNSDGIVRFGRILDVWVVGGKGLRVVVVSAVILLVLTFAFLLFVEFALVFLVL
jgi:hypothetical protein